GVDDGPALAGERAIDVEDGLLVDAAEIDPQLGAFARLDEAALAEPDGFDGLVVGQHRQHELAGFGDRLGRVPELGALLLEALRLLAFEIVHDQAIAGLDQVGGHAAAHAAGADETQGLHASHSFFSRPAGFPRAPPQAFRCALRLS